MKAEEFDFIRLLDDDHLLVFCYRFLIGVDENIYRSSMA